MLWTLHPTDLRLHFLEAAVCVCRWVRFLIIILLFYSIDACLYFQFVFHFVVVGGAGGVDGLTHRLVLSLSSTQNGWQRWNYICLSAWFILRSCCVLSDIERFQVLKVHRNNTWCAMLAEKKPKQLPISRHLKWNEMTYYLCLAQR